MLVSVIVPNFNNAASLERCIASLLNQTYPNIEVVVVDDCSSDNSKILLKTISDTDSRVKVIENSVNTGVALARNLGFSYSSGDFLTTVDSDDEFHPQKIEKELGCIIKSDDFTCVAYSDTILLKNGEFFIQKCDLWRFHNFYEALLLRKCVIPRDVMFHKSHLIDGCLLFDRKLNRFEDWDFKIRLFSRAKPIYSDSVGTIYNLHDKGLSKGSYISILSDIFRVFIKNLTHKSILARFFLGGVLLYNVVSSYLKKP